MNLQQRQRDTGDPGIPAGKYPGTAVSTQRESLAGTGESFIANEGEHPLISPSLENSNAPCSAFARAPEIPVRAVRLARPWTCLITVTGNYRCWLSPHVFQLALPSIWRGVLHDAASNQFLSFSRDCRGSEIDGSNLAAYSHGRAWIDELQ